MADKLIIASNAADAAKALNNRNIFIAGGTDVMRLGSDAKSEAFVSVRKAKDMRKITPLKSSVKIGAACTFQELIDSDEIPEYFKEALRFMGSRTRRNMATIGGNIALKRDDSFIIPTLIASGADINIMSKDGKRSKVSVQEYVSGSKEYNRKLIAEILLSTDKFGIKSVRSANTAQSHARLTLSLALRGGSYKPVACVKNSGIYVLDDLAEFLSSKDKPSEDEIVAFVKGLKEIKLEDDLLYGSADYRRYLIGIHFALMYEELNSKGGRAK